MRTVLTLAALAATAAFPATVSGQDGEKKRPSPVERFQNADTNGDGKLTQEEAEKGGMKRLAQHFGHLDSDGDGFVTLEQLKERMGKRGKGGKRKEKPES